MFKNILAKLSELEQLIVKLISRSSIRLDKNSVMFVVSDEHIVLFNKLSHSPGHSMWTLALLEILHGG